MKNQESFEPVVNNLAHQAEADKRQAELAEQLAGADAAVARFHEKMDRKRRERLKIEVARYTAFGAVTFIVAVGCKIGGYDIIADAAGVVTAIVATISAYGYGLLHRK